MPVAVFQGILNVPLFRAPYTVPFSGTNGMPLCNNASDWANFSYGVYGVDGNTSAFNKCFGFQTLRFQPSGYQSVKYGNTNVSGSLITAVNGYSVMSGEWSYGAMENYTLYPSSNNTYRAGSVNVPMSISASYSVPPGIYDWGANSAARNFIANPTNIATQQISVGIVEFQSLNVPGLAIIGQPNTLSYDTLQMVTLPFPDSGFYNYAIGSSYPIIGSTGFIIPGRTSPTNFWWQPNTSGIAMTITKVVAQYSIQTGFSSLQFGAYDFFTFDNATLNSALAAARLQFRASANGVTVYDSSNLLPEYYINKDGTKYWQLNYVDYSGLGVKSGITTTGSTRFIDAAGTFWYTDKTARLNNTTMQPLYSLGVNIPWNPVTLPQIPPMSMPCWSDCLDRLGGQPGKLFNTI
jgi:hypothetical protein